ncbi:MAG: hypothetical protein WCF67_25135 [Chitinophagaceae bacterium]
MKRMLLLIVCAGTLVMMSCQKDPAPSFIEKAKSMVLGKWMLDHALEEEYDGSNTLLFREDYTGTPADSVIFRNDNTSHSYSALNYDEESDYEILNDSTIRIEMEVWKIATLTETKFDLYAEDREPGSNARYVQRIFMKR